MFSAYQSIFMPSVHGAQGNNIVPPHVTCGMVGLRPFYNSEATSPRHFERKRKDSILERIKQRAIERKKLWRQWNRERLSRIGTTPPHTLPAPFLPPLDPFYILSPSPIPDFCFLRHYHSSTSSNNTPMPMEDVQYQRDIAPLTIVFKPNTTSGSVGSAKPDKPQRKHDRRVRRVIPDE
ncbi:hypothetical protein BDF22DRAFT_779168 [Syncephalis plumigaleata]|nr:hypothetical protein BDF22DRAFT_779168 [Syncephalis plumigaleata]